MPLTPGTRLGSFEIVGPLGAGGMGEVYRARDVRLGREVALKVLAERHAADAQRRERLLREARAVSRVSHPNVVRIYEVGEQGELRYIVSELVEGRTLRALLGEGPLPAPRVVELGAQLVAGLAAAHDQGVVHRDLKPENLIVTSDGRLEILDFGIAQLSDEARGEAADAVTETVVGSLLGTSGYLAPEQARGESVDSRADLFAVGAILFEALTGEPAFPGRGTVDRLSSVLRDDPLGRPVAAALPDGLSRVLARCLAKAPEERFQTARDLGFALASASLAPAQGPRRRARRWFAPAAALLAALAAGLAGAVISSKARPVPIASLAVLPLQALGVSSSNDDPSHLGLGLADALITRLGSVEGLQVRPIGAARVAAGAGDPLAAGRSLRVDAVLDGTVQRERGRLRLRAHLRRVRDGALLWSGTFEEDAGDLFAVQDELVVRMAEALRPALTEGERAALVRHEATDPVAFEHFLEGRYLWGRRDEASLRRAVAVLELAVAREPGFARAHAALGDALALLAEYADEGRYERARRHARESMRLDPELAEGYLVLALVAHNRDLDWAASDTAYRRALELEPDNAMALHRYGEIQVLWGHFDAGIERLLRARQLDPVSPILAVDLGKSYWYARRLAKAERVLQEVVADHPDFALAHAYLGMTLVEEGRRREGLDALRRFVELDRSNVALAVLGWGLATTGDPAGARRLLAEIEASQPDIGGRDFAVAIIGVGLGDHDLALDALQRMVARRSHVLALDTHPMFMPLHGDPRFATLLRAAGLPYQPQRRF